VGALSGGGGKGVRLSGWEKFLVGWLFACVIIHGMIEGTWALVIGPQALKAVDPTKTFWTTPWTDYVPANETFPSNLWTTYKNMWAHGWREYAKGDSRYMKEYDPFVITMEAFTAVVDTTLAAIAGYGILHRKAYRYPILLLVSAFQLYGDVLYFLTEYIEGYMHVDFSHWLYYIVYFTFFNTFWIVIPIISIVYATYMISQAFRQLEGKKNK